MDTMSGKWTAKISSLLCLYQHNLNPHLLSSQNLMQNLFRNPMMDLYSMPMQNLYLMLQFLLQARKKNLKWTNQLLLTRISQTILGLLVSIITRLALVSNQRDSLCKQNWMKTKQTLDITTSLCSQLKQMLT